MGEARDWSRVCPGSMLRMKAAPRGWRCCECGAGYKPSKAKRLAPLHYSPTVAAKDGTP